MSDSLVVTDRNLKRKKLYRNVKSLHLPPALRTWRPARHSWGWAARAPWPAGRSPPADGR